MNTIYPYPEPGSIHSGRLLTFYGMLRGRLKNINEDLGLTPLVDLQVDVGMGALPSNRMMRVCYWEWHVENDLPLQ